LVVGTLPLILSVDTSTVRPKRRQHAATNTTKGRYNNAKELYAAYNRGCAD
jgi:hypothetical protein